MYIFGEISTATAEEVVRRMDTDGINKIVLDTQGGDLLAAMAIYDAIVGRGVTVVGTGQVASAGVCILLGGDNRYCTKHTRFLTHGVYLAGEGDATDEDQRDVQIVQNNMAKIISDRTGMDLAYAEKMLDTTVTFGMQEAINMGFVDGEWNDRTRLR